MGSAILQCGRFPDVWNFVLKLRKVQIWAVPNCKGVDLLIVRNDDFRLRKFQILAVLSSKAVDLVMLYKCVFRVRNV